VLYISLKNKKTGNKGAVRGGRGRGRGKANTTHKNKNPTPQKNQKQNTNPHWLDSGQGKEDSVRRGKEMRPRMCWRGMFGGALVGRGHLAGMK